MTKRLLASVMAFAMLFTLLPTAALADNDPPSDVVDVVYVDGVNGDDENDGTSKEAAVETLVAAYDKLREAGGTIVVCGDVTQGTSSWNVPAKPVTFTSVYEGEDYTSSAVLTINCTWKAHAALTFENIVISASNKVIYANGNKLTFGEGVTMATHGVTDPGLSLYGTDKATVGKTDIVIQSGLFRTVSGGASTASGSVTGDVSMEISGGSITALYTSSGNNSVEAKGVDKTATVTISGGVIGNFYGAAAPCGSEKITISGGEIGIFYSLYRYGTVGSAEGGSADPVIQMDITGGEIGTFYAGGYCTTSAGTSVVHGNVELNLTDDVGGAFSIANLYLRAYGSSAAHGHSAITGNLTVHTTQTSYANAKSVVQDAACIAGGIEVDISDAQGEDPFVPVGPGDEDQKVTGEGNEGSPYLLTTAEQIEALAKALSADADNRAEGLLWFPEGATTAQLQTAHYRLEDNITLVSGKTYSTDLKEFFCGIGSTSYPFKGDFDGNREAGYQITVQYDYTADAVPINYYIGVFSVTNDAVIHDLVVSDDSYFKVDQSSGVNLYGSMLIGHCSGKTVVQNCTVGGTAEVDFGERFFHNIRFGFIGGNFLGTIEDSTVTKGSTIQISGVSTSSGNGMARGAGIASLGGDATLRNCVNHANVTVEHGTAAGLVSAHNAAKIELEGCVNTGAILALSGSAYALDFTVDETTYENCVQQVEATGSWQLVAGETTTPLTAVDGVLDIPITAQGGNTYSDEVYLLSGDGARYVFSEENAVYVNLRPYSGYVGEPVFTEMTPLVISTAEQYLQVKAGFSGDAAALNAIFADTAAASATTSAKQTLLMQAHLKIGEDFSLGTPEAPLREPLGLGSTLHPFGGSVDGNGKTVAMYVSMEDASCDISSFVGVLDDNASGEIKDLTLVGALSYRENSQFHMSYVPMTTLVRDVPQGYVIRGCASRVSISYENDGSSLGSGTLFAGGLARYAYGEMENCTNEGDITVTEKSGYYATVFAGGICADAYNVLTGCKNTADITLKANSAYGGGIAGRLNAGSAVDGCTNEGSVSVASEVACYVGGIAGATNGANEIALTDCVNSGAVDAYSANNASSAGGIVGNLYLGNTGKGLTNSGDIYAGSDASSARAGGIAAVVSMSSATAAAQEELLDTANSGTITAKSYNSSYVGGIVGLLQYRGTLSNAKNTGKIIGISTDSGTYTGGLVGSISGSNQREISGGVNEGAVLGQVTLGTAYVGGLVGSATWMEMDACVNVGSVAGEYVGQRNGSAYVGGLVGYMAASAEAAIKRSASTGAVSISASGSGSYNAGGAIGRSGATAAQPLIFADNLIAAPISVVSTAAGSVYDSPVFGYIATSGGRITALAEASADNYFSVDVGGAEESSGYNSGKHDSITALKLNTPLTLAFDDNEGKNALAVGASEQMRFSPKGEGQPSSSIEGTTVKPAGDASGVDEYNAEMPLNTETVTMPAGYDAFAVPFGTLQVIVGTSTESVAAVTVDSEATTHTLTTALPGAPEQDSAVTIKAIAKDGEGDPIETGNSSLVIWKFYSDADGTKELSATALANYASVAVTGNELAITADKTLITRYVFYVRAVSAVDSGKTSDMLTIAIMPRPITGLTITADGIGDGQLAMLSGVTAQLGATVLPQSANQDVVWSSSDVTVATVSAGGLVTALRGGTATITAASKQTGSVSDSLTVHILSSISGLSVSLEETMAPGDTASATAEIFYQGGKVEGSSEPDGVVWSSSNTEVATIDSNSGEITAAAPGTTTITATSVGRGADGNVVAASAQLTVYQEVERVQLNKNALDLLVGNSETLTAVVSPDNATNPGVKWKSSDTSVATVDSFGLVRAVGIGEATVTVSSAENADLSDEVTVTVSSLNNTIQSMSLADGDVIDVQDGFTIEFTEPMGGTPVVSLNGDGSASVVWRENATVLAVDLSGLTKNTEYTITISGVAYSNGRAFDPITVACRTIKDPQAEEVLLIVSGSESDTILDGNENATPDNVKVQYTEEVTTKEEAALAESSAIPRNYSISGFFGLNLLVNDEVVEPAKLNRAVTVTIDWDVVSGRQYRIAHLLDDKTVEILTATASVKDKTLTFSVTELSPFAVLSRSNSNSGGSVTYYSITARADENGSISPSGAVSVRFGDGQTFVITPKEGYLVDDVRVDGKSVGAVSKYTFENVHASHTIAASFVKENDGLADGFADVSDGAYYADAVAWALDQGITSGTSATTFSPDASCTRAQMVTFLWRAAGAPTPKAGGNPFEDVQSGAYYYDAVLWAVQQGITSGTSATTFSPDEVVTRGQTVTFLYRAAGSPVVVENNPFTDVEPDAYYAQAVLWAFSKGVTSGTDDHTFSPNADCTRAQIVTFLYRATQK